MWQAPELICPTFVDVDIFWKYVVAEFPKSLVSASVVVSSHILLHDDHCTPLTIHHEFRDLQSIRKFWILGLPGFFTGALSWAKLLLHLRSFFFITLFDLFFLDSISIVFFHFVWGNAFFT